MKTLYPFLCVVLGSLSGVVAVENPAGGAGRESALRDQPPVGKYTGSFELKQLDGVPGVVTLQVKGQQIEGTSERLGKLQGRFLQFAGNQVYVVRLTGTGYTATQMWAFQPDGSVEIREVPDRGEKQVLSPVR